MTKSFFVKTLFLVALSAALMADANHPTGTRGLLLIDKVGSYIRFFDPVTFKERSSVQVATKPHDFVLTPDRKTAYVPLYGDGIFNRNPNPGHEVAIVDMDAAKVVGSIDTSPVPRAARDSDRTRRHDLCRQRSRPQAARHRPEDTQDDEGHRHRGHDALDRDPAERHQDLRDEQERSVRHRCQSEDADCCVENPRAGRHRGYRCLTRRLARHRDGSHGTGTGRDRSDHRFDRRAHRTPETRRRAPTRPTSAPTASGC